MAKSSSCENSEPEELKTSTMALPPIGERAIIDCFNKTDPLYKSQDSFFQEKEQVIVSAALLCGSTKVPEIMRDRVESVFGSVPDNCYLVITERTIFQPSIRSQPCDTGYMRSSSIVNGLKPTFTVVNVRDNGAGTIWHLGFFEPAFSSFRKHQYVQQEICTERRKLHSRLHVAGHLIGLAVKEMVKWGTLPGNIAFKAVRHGHPCYHVDFHGLISLDGEKTKTDIAREVNEFMRKDARLQILSEDLEAADCFIKVDETQSSLANGPMGRVHTYRCAGTFVPKAGLIISIEIIGIARNQNNNTTVITYKVGDKKGEDSLNTSQNDSHL